VGNKKRRRVSATTSGEFDIAFELHPQSDGSDTASDDAPPITEPFDPTAIRVRTVQLSVDSLLERIRLEELILTPDFQRNEVWKIEARSRLIESALIQIPLPAVYVDATDDNCWLVIDGLQRLSTFQHFVADESFALKGLEFLSELENKRFSSLPRAYQRRIRETQISVNQLDPGTPSAVKYNLFKRINTGGLPLSPQEIRHALLQGKSTILLKEIAESKQFLRATYNGVSPDRMGDRETILRALAFMLVPYERYDGDFDTFLRNAMVRINSLSNDEIDQLREAVERGMETAAQVFGRSAYRKRPGTPINKALFEVWTVAFAELKAPDRAKLVSNGKTLADEAIALNQTYDFEQAISVATGNKRKIHYRFSKVQALVAAFLAR
jgi:hypothetical protein